MNILSIISTFVIITIIVLMLGRGMYLLLSSPYVFRMDKKKNCCTREKKFIWQEKYKIKTLCQLSEVKEALRIGGVFYNYVGLCLKLKTGRVIRVFTDSHLHGFASLKLSIKEFDKQIKEINSFLDNKKEQYIAESPVTIFGIFWFSLGCILLLTIGLMFYCSITYRI